MLRAQPALRIYTGIRSICVVQEGGNTVLLNQRSAAANARGHTVVFGSHGSVCQRTRLFYKRPRVSTSAPARRAHTYSPVEHTPVALDAGLVFQPSFFAGLSALARAGEQLVGDQEVNDTRARAHGRSRARARASKLSLAARRRRAVRSQLRRPVRNFCGATVRQSAMIRRMAARTAP